MFPTPKQHIETYCILADNSQDRDKTIGRWFPNSKDKHEKFIQEKTKHEGKLENAQGRKSKRPPYKI